VYGSSLNAFGHRGHSQYPNKDFLYFEAILLALGSLTGMFYFSFYWMLLLKPLSTNPTN
jgi:hypothetical protein